MRLVFANSVSKDTDTILLKKRAKNNIMSADNTRSDNISVLVIVRILPKRYSDRLGAYPGVRNVKTMPMAMPSDQNTAIAESSRTPCLRDSHWMPNAESTANAIADIIGGKEKKNPIPNPPKEA